VALFSNLLHKPFDVDLQSLGHEVSFATSLVANSPDRPLPPTVYLNRRVTTFL
jgi:hypothetical protein